MKEKYNVAIHTYFSDYVSWLLLVSFFFIVSLASSVAFNEKNNFIWIIPISFLTIYLLSTPLLVLYCKAIKDIKKSNIDKLIIKISEIRDDNKFNFRNSGGAIVGKNKYKIVDKNNNIYLLSTSNKKDMFRGFNPQPNFYLEIEVLKKSKLVLSMRIIENSKTNKEYHEQQHNITHFRKIFNHLF